MATHSPQSRVVASRVNEIVGRLRRSVRDRDETNWENSSAIFAALALKFYTVQGNRDLVGNNTPAFFDARSAEVSGFESCGETRPAYQFAQPEKQLGFLDVTAGSLTPGHHRHAADRGIPSTHRHMHGFGSHTFSFINAKNERYWVKFHFRSQQGIKNLTDAEARGDRRQGP